MPDTATVRMYDVGFGDCFLIEFPRQDAGRPFRILVDCGAHTSGYPRAGWSPKDAVDAIIADLGDTPRLDVVVATHRHQDHVSGFASDRWREVEVGEVWMPWTEHPTDAEAREVRERQSRLALGLDLAFGTQAFAKRWTRPGPAEALQAVVRNSLTNTSAMRVLHHGFRGDPLRRFLESATPPARLNPAGCPGLTVHVLGPSRDRDIIRDMDPPAGQSYLRHLAAAPAAAKSATRATYRPFDLHFALPAGTYEAPVAYGPVADEDLKKAAVSAMRSDDFAAAVSLDKAVNGTSLMLVFAYRGAHLLFPGDAQWGTWQAALRDPATRELLAHTTFYKVGHHGSHNATPVEFVKDVLPAGRTLWAAAASVHPVANWPEIPREPLLTALREHCDRVVRSDQPASDLPGTALREGIGIDFHVPLG